MGRPRHGTHRQPGGKRDRRRLTDSGGGWDRFHGRLNSYTKVPVLDAYSLLRKYAMNPVSSAGTLMGTHVVEFSV
jgi:hypothetical protein